MRQRSLLSSLALVIAAMSTSAAGQGRVVRNARPAALSDPRKPVMKYDDVFAPVPAHFVHRPGRSDELLDGAALKNDHRKIVGFSLESLEAGDKLWGRRAATPAFMHTIEWIVNEFKAAGLKDAKVETYAVTVTDVGAAVVGGAGRRRSGLRRRDRDGDAAVRVSAAGRRDDCGQRAHRARDVRRARHGRRSRGARREGKDCGGAHPPRAVAVRIGRTGRGRQARRAWRGRRDQRGRGARQRAVRRHPFRLRQGAVLHGRRPGWLVPRAGDRQGGQRRRPGSAEDHACAWRRKKRPG